MVSSHHCPVCFKQPTASCCHKGHITRCGVCASFYSPRKHSGCTRCKNKAEREQWREKQAAMDASPPSKKAGKKWKRQKC